MTAYLSQKIRLMSLFTTIMVVFLHANLIQYSSGFTLFTQRLLTEEVTRVAVPYFFLMSGFLFFRNSSHSNSFFSTKLKRRALSIVLPYLILTVAGGIVWACVKRTGMIPTVIESILLTPKLFYQLWFLHDLILLFVLSPLIYLILRKAPWLWLIPFLLWMFGRYNAILNYESLCWWGIGGLLSMHCTNIMERVASKKDSVVIIIAITIWVALSVVRVTLGLPFFVHAISIIVGVFAIWRGYDLLPCRYRESKTANNMAAYSFFIFLFHEPVLAGVKYYLLLLLPMSNSFILLIYLLSPIITVVLVLVIARVWKCTHSKTYTIITGGRTQ